MHNRICLVTGANKGIGLETARQLAAGGATVIVAARTLDKARQAESTLRAENLSAQALALDVESMDSIRAASQVIAGKFGLLDSLVNNAGVFLEAPDSVPSRVTSDLLRKTFATNFFGVVEVTQALLPLVRKSKAGRIVNLTSILGSLSEHSDPKSPIHGMLTVGYNASKAAVNMFTINLAHELRATGIKVNAAHPGWVKTDMGGPNAPLEVGDGAKTSVWLATLPDDGPTGGYFHLRERIRW